MLDLFALTSAVFLVLPPAYQADAQATSPRFFTLEETVERSGPLSIGPPNVAWHAGGEQYVAHGQLHDTHTRERVGKAPSERDAALDELALVLGLTDEDGALDVSGLRRRDASATEQVVLASRDAALYVVRGDFVRRMEAAEDGELHDLSPDGRWLAWHTDGDLFVADTLTDDVRALTAGGGPKLLHGKLDWVYQEEVYGRGNFKGFWWSPDSTHVALLRLDESPVFDFTVIDHLHPDGSMRVLPEITSYPKAGDPNPVVDVLIANAATGRHVHVDFGQDPFGPEKLVVRVSWTPAGESALLQVQDRIQTRLDLIAVDPESGASSTWIEERSETWVNVLAEPRWLSAGDFLWESERSGHRHVYRYQPGGALVGAVTAGDWDVLELERVADPNADQPGRLWFTTNKDGALERQLYAVRLDGTGLTRLTREPGTHAVDVAENGWFLDRHSRLAGPPARQVLLCDPSGERVHAIGADSEDTNGDGDAEKADELDAYALATWELVKIPTRDGFELDGALLKPVDFDPTAVYPVWLPTYSGPDAPSVADRWNQSTWYQFLAQRGVIVMQVNVRSASRKGHAVISSCYLELGVGELRDLEDAVDWLCANPWADAERVGITGWSYGGFMSAYAMVKSDRFALAIAGAGVYDWRLYDTIYTERFMRTPQQNPEGYTRTSVIEAAKQAESLPGHMVLLHGTMDDNVHLQNTIQLAYALQQSGLDFELMLYPRSRHGIREERQLEHRRRLEWRAIQQQLLGVR